MDELQQVLNDLQAREGFDDIGDSAHAVAIRNAFENDLGGKLIDAGFNLQDRRDAFMRTRDGSYINRNTTISWHAFRSGFLMGAHWVSILRSQDVLIPSLPIPGARQDG